MSQVQLSIDDYEEDPMEACEQWQVAIETVLADAALKAEEAQKAQFSEPLRVTRSPFSTGGGLLPPWHYL